MLCREIITVLYRTHNCTVWEERQNFVILSLAVQYPVKITSPGTVCFELQAFTHSVLQTVAEVSYSRVSFLRQFTLSTLVQSDRAVPTYGASLSQLKRPFSTLVRFQLFSGVHVFLLFLFQCSSFMLIVILPRMASIKKRDEKRKSKQLTLHSLLMSSEPQPGSSLTK